ncbi:hypothetical protein PGT21_016715 [Puccinia graminis f. sp. tritici]|uniref:Uncharacterized protein n=1 Tax=Puccinia graminis f. sp. tritici TaxID=56615 RepID=A0A5B0NYJ3_PUCGR|nr:hypothetical protein PGT21_016715 [Puccinia graminis f. sp. tritici]
MQMDESESPTMVAGGGASAVYSRSTVSNISRSSIDFQSSPQERALVSQLLNKIGLYPEELSPEAKSPIINGAAYHPVKKYGSLDQLGPPPPKRIVQASYTELQRAVAETPLMWADENPSSSSGTNERKRDSTGWLYSSATPYQLESWSATSSATLGLMSASRPKPPLNSLLRQRQQLLIQGRPGVLGGTYRLREDSRSSTLSSSTTVGRLSPSDRTTTSKSEQSSSNRALRRTSRRQEALRPLGIPSSTDSCLYTNEYDSERGDERGEGSLGSEGEEEEEDRPGQEAEWDYIDVTDHDHRVQGWTCI